MTRFGTPGYKMIRGMFNDDFDGGDPFGSAMEWFFALADFLWHGSALEIPAAWEYGHAPSCREVDTAGSFAAACLMAVRNHFTDEDLLAFGNVLHRYVRLCILAGRDY